MAKRSEYKNTKPLPDDELFKEVKKLHSELAGLEAEAEGRKEDHDKAKKDCAVKLSQIREILRASNEDRAVYRFKNGEITTEPPDSQGDLPGAS